MSDNPLEPDSLNHVGIDTVIVAGSDMQGRLFGKRMSPRVFRREPRRV
jgi:glutamine synthetase